MAISLASLNRATALKPPRILIHGVAGVGKTTFAAGAPDPVFVLTEDGLGTLEVEHFPLAHSFDEVDAALTALYAEGHGFKTLVIDSVDWLEPLIWAKACQLHGWKSIEDAGYGRTLVPPAPAGKIELPASRTACRAAIDQLRGEIDAIRAQIATADLERQAKRGKMDPRWYHRARTAIRHKRQQIAALTAHLHALPPDRKLGFKDCLIEVLRDEFDDQAWEHFLDRAHALHDQREGA